MPGTKRSLRKMAAYEVESILASLPEPLAVKARQVPVLFEALPDSVDGEDMDLLGLFTGSELAHEGDDPMPSQIILFLENIRDEAEGNELAFRNEVRITYLHELGHYLGLDEDDLLQRGLE